MIKEIAKELETQILNQEDKKSNGNISKSLFDNEYIKLYNNPIL